ncbi:MAG: mechanosensitive ion channel family protein [Thainema sp.]
MHIALGSMMHLIEPLSGLLGGNSLPLHLLLQADANSAVDYAEWLGELAIQLGLKILAAIAVLIVGTWIAKWLRRLTRRLMTKRDVDATVVAFIGNLVYYGALIAVVIVALSQLGVETASFVAVLGAAGLAIGLALQGSLSNFAAGILIILFRPFKAGDFIETAGAMGIVEQVEIFTTTLKTPDNCKVIVPNSSILSNNIKNFSGYPTRRVDMVFGIGYSDDVDKARQIIWDVLNEDSRILADPEPTVSLFQLADSSVNFAVRPWVNGADYWTVMCDTTETIKKRFDAADINIPFPQREVHVYQK